MYSGDTVIIQDGPARWLIFKDRVHARQTSISADIIPVIGLVDQDVRNGCYAAGYILYEAATGLDAALSTHISDGVLPLVWFGVYRSVEVVDTLPPPCEGYESSSWTPDLSPDEYRDALKQIRNFLQSGDTYQVNYTFRLRSHVTGSSYAMFHAMVAAQEPNYAAFMRIGRHTISSASPELFWEQQGTRIWTRPMKGTSARGRSSADDEKLAEVLHASEKNRSENVMIVDMIRNDLGKIAIPGSVKVGELCAVERYPTVFQMTSLVEAETLQGLAPVMKAMFPCASVTGAPKARTMQIIRALERSPRGVYTGTIGFLAPGSGSQGEEPVRRSRFNVAIRTVVVNEDTGVATYGVGGGIVWESKTEDEYAECMAKAAILSAAPVPEFSLIETMLWNKEEGFFLEEYHLRRLAHSARYFGVNYSEASLRSTLTEVVNGISGQQRVRVLVNRQGIVRVETIPQTFPALTKVRQVGVHGQPVDAGNKFLYHKTTRRDAYDKARQLHHDWDDTLFVNTRGELTESSIANLVLKIGNKLLTPPVASGLLPGTFREFLLEKGILHEAILRLEDLRQAEAVYLINSVQKWMPVRIVQQ